MGQGIQRFERWSSDIATLFRGGREEVPQTRQTGLTQGGQPRVLVVCPSWVGDMVMAQSLFRVLKAQQPALRIDALAPDWSLGLLRCMPEINEAFALPVDHGQLKLVLRKRIASRLRRRGYQQAIVLPNSFKSALVPFWAGIPRRTGWIGEMRFGLLNDARRLDKGRLAMTVERFVALAAGKGELANRELPGDFPKPRLRPSAESVRGSLASFGLTTEQRPILAIAPGAEYGPAKRWSTQRFGRIASDWIGSGGQVWLFGSKKDQGLSRQVDLETGGRCVDLTGKTDLRQAVDLLSVARIALCNDSGLMHVAAALERPLVAIYGSSDPGFTPPLGEQCRVVSAGVACSPCFKRTCPDGSYACLEKIEVSRIQREMDELLGQKGNE
jgi:heptosyltransferase-2